MTDFVTVIEVGDTPDIAITVIEEEPTTVTVEAVFLTTGSATETVHNQTVPAMLWVITHNQGSHPSATCTRDDGTIIHPTPHYNSSNQIILTFSEPVTGRAYLHF
jgi:hypothetical protein